MTSMRALKVSDLEHLGLAGACTRIADRYKRNPGSVSGEVFAWIAKRLIASEVKPGGPYHDQTGRTTAVTNIAVGYLFSILEKPLPHVDAYIDAIDLATLSLADQKLLQKYYQARKLVRRKPRAKHGEAYHQAQAVYAQLTDPTRQQALDFLQQVARADVTGEIASIAAYTAQTIDAHVPHETLQRLGEANIHGWTAYTIYDHILDGEMTVARLPVANIAMRLALGRYKDLFASEHAFHSVIASYFNQVDTANAWELQHGRFRIQDNKIHIGQLPDYKQHDVLARRSGIHILGPLAIAHISKWDPGTTKQLETGLRHYLIARQLSDDIHDWQEDIRAGQISAVVTQLFKHAGTKPGEHHIEQLIDDLQNVFWHRTMKTVTDLIIDHAEQANKHLLAVNCKPTGRLITLVNRLRDMASTSMQERERFAEFAQAYRTIS